MYAKILILLAFFFLSFSSVSAYNYLGWVNSPWKQRHTQTWSYSNFGVDVITLLQRGDLAGATRAQEAAYRRDNHGESVQYRFYRSGNSIALACNNGWLTVFHDLPPPAPPIAGACNATGELAAELPGPSCTIGAGSAFTVSTTNPKQYTWTCAGQNGGANRSCSAQFTHPECDPATSNTTLLTSPFNNPTCKYGTVSGFTGSTDNTGKVTYSWRCEKTNGVTASCNAYYKELDPTNCDERRTATDPANITQFGHPARLPEQCTYSVIPNQPTISMTGLVMATQDGPSVVTLTGAYGRSNNGIPGNCVVPANGVPQIDFTSIDPFTTITSTRSSFTLPSSITQKIGNGTVNFNAPDTCNPRVDTVTLKAVNPDCNPSIIDTTSPQYCERVITESDVCVALNDKYGNPVYNYATNRITTVLGQVEKNEYFSKYNSGTDTTQYAPGSFTEVGNNYCSPICVECDTRIACTKGIPLPAKCSPVLPPPPSTPICVEFPGSPDCPVTSPICTPSFANNYCNPIGEITPTPIIATNPGGEISFDKSKACTGGVEVWNGSNWTSDGDSIIYDEPSMYRVVVRGSDPVCQGGIIEIKSVGARGGVLTNPIAYTSTGAFTATVRRDATDTPTTARGVNVIAVYTQPGGLVYGLTAIANDFFDAPLTISGNRMKGVRIIGNSAGTNISNFNLNNAGVIGEVSGPNVATTRNAMLKNAALLTRGMDSGDTINNIRYIEGDWNTSALGTGFSTLIIKGNLTIDTNISDSDQLKGLIVLKGSNGAGGKIIVGDNVRYINALIFAEETLLGRSTDPSVLNPERQLVLKGTLFSRNTVGGSADSTNLYLAGGGKTDDSFAAFQQDLNNVRNGYGCPEGELTCGLYEKNGFTYLDPFIIDFDNMQANPPPGFSNIQ